MGKRERKQREAERKSRKKGRKLENYSSNKESSHNVHGVEERKKKIITGIKT